MVGRPNFFKSIARLIDKSTSGQFSKACKRLISEPLCTSNVRQWSTCRTRILQPDCYLISRPSKNFLMVYTCWLKMRSERPLFRFLKAQLKVPRSCGHNTWSIYSSRALDYDFIFHLTAVCNILVQAKAPKVISQHIAEATLIGCPKKNKNDLGSIAVEETIRRLVFKGLCKHATSSAKNYIWPSQLGVGVPPGSEIACTPWQIGIKGTSRQG